MMEAVSPNTDQTVARDRNGRFAKGNKPKNGFDKNPQNIAPGGYWRYKRHGKSAILDIFKMSLADFNSYKNIKDTEKTVLDEALFIKFKSAMNGNSRDMDFLFSQAFGAAPTYKECQHQHYHVFEHQKDAVFKSLTKEDIEKLLHDDGN